MRPGNKNLLLGSAVLGCLAGLPAYANTHTSTGTFDADQALASAFGIQLSGSAGPISWSLADISVSLNGLLSQNFDLTPYVSTDLYIPLAGQNDYCTQATGCGAIDVPTGFERRHFRRGQYRSGGPIEIGA